MPQYVILDEHHDLIYVCDTLVEAEHYKKTWEFLNDSPEFATKAFIYVMERLY